MEDFIQLEKSNLIKIGIKDENGNVLDGQLVFDLEDIELPIRYQEMFEEHKKNENYVRHQFLIIDKKEDHKGKKLLSSNTEAKLRVVNEFYRREMEALDMFIGEGKTQMLLDLMHRKPYIGMFDDIGKALQPLSKILDKNMETTEEKIKEKYKISEEDILQ